MSADPHALALPMQPSVQSSVQSSAQPSPTLPHSEEACRARLIVLRDEMASIRLRIAASDIRRQHLRQSVNPDGFHRMKTALRMRRREADEIALHLAELRRTHRPPCCRERAGAAHPKHHPET
ncbi:MAG: hypothetical protein FJ252_08595 [Phycisphaerae bacterium]|nr:hypothetical protein [Phycisphaerae bacterium]